MRILFALFLLVALPLSLFGEGCYKLPCHLNIQQAKNKDELEITKVYQELHIEMENMKNHYEQQLEKLKKQNALLEKYKASLSFSNLQQKELAFLLRKFNKLQGNKNTLEGVKK